MGEANGTKEDPGFSIDLMSRNQGNKIDINVIDLNKEINSHLIDIRKIYAKNNKLNHFNEDGYKIISQILSEKIF